MPGKGLQTELHPQPGSLVFLEYFLGESQDFSNPPRMECLKYSIFSGLHTSMKNCSVKAGCNGVCL
jgi:hypothetical protein